jgi:hypothetical protein
LSCCTEFPRNRRGATGTTAWIGQLSASAGTCVWSPAATTSGSAGDSWAGRCLFRQRRDQQSNYHQHRAADCSGGLQAFSLKKFGRRGRARSASVCEFRKNRRPRRAFAAPPLFIPRLSTRSFLGTPIMSNIYLDNRSLTLMPFCLDLIEIQTTKSSGVSN